MGSHVLKTFPLSGLPRCRLDERTMSISNCICSSGTTTTAPHVDIPGPHGVMVWITLLKWSSSTSPQFPLLFFPRSPVHLTQVGPLPSKQESSYAKQYQFNLFLSWIRSKGLSTIKDGFCWNSISRLCPYPSPHLVDVTTDVTLILWPTYILRTPLFYTEKNWNHRL